MPAASPCPASSASGSTTIRDAAMKQIIYGTQAPGAGLQVVGTVDFTYLAPNAASPWATAYGTNYNCVGSPPQSTPLRCDDPVGYSGGNNAPSVMSTLSLQTITSYAGSDTSGNKAYGYSFVYQDYPFSACTDPLHPTIHQYCAGEHLLQKVTPVVYQQGPTAHTLKPVQFSYQQETDTYYDASQTVFNGSSNVPFSMQTGWQYLSAYMDTNSGIGAHITYATAYNNTHVTPTDPVSGDDRHDPTYCFTHTSGNYQCTGSYAHPDDHAWAEQVVTSITGIGMDSSALSATTTSYSFRLAVIPGHTCTTVGTDSDCVGDNWIPVNPGPPPVNDSDWADFYHGEFHGFNDVNTLSPAGDLTADAYFSTDGWWTPEGNLGNYNAGQLYQEDIYSGANAVQTALLRETLNSSPGMRGTPSACNGNINLTYVPCLIMVYSSTTTTNEGSSSSSSPLVEHDYQYDDYNSSGLAPGYHNLQQETIKSSNAIPSSPGGTWATKIWTYTPTDSGTNGTGWLFYDVNKVTQSEVDDSTGHKWQCQSFTYDGNAPAGAPSGTPGAGWPTTANTYTNNHCTMPTLGAPLTTSYSDYDAFGNVVATVDAVGAAKAALYGNGGIANKNGCTLATAPVIFSSAWSKTNYTSCTTYDSYNAQPTNMTNAFGQQTSITYDPTQGSLPVQSTDVNNQQTATTYSYDANSASNGMRTVGITQPGDAQGTFTSQSSSNSTCTTSLPYQVNNLLPCFEIDSKSAQYPNATAQTFYDSYGRAVETSTPTLSPTGSGNYYTIVLTEYKDNIHSVWKSIPFVAAGGTGGAGWLDPATAKDYTNASPTGTATYYDALGRQIAVQDPAFGTASEPGIACQPLINVNLGPNATACTVYGLGTAYKDTSNTVYATTTSIDPNNHVSITFADSLGQITYVQYDSGVNSGTLTPNEQKSMKYNVLGEPTSVVVSDEAPQNGQTVKTITTTAQYDDLGRITQLVDPDRGTHNYTYDADGGLLSDVSGTRTLGYNNDLLGRVGCVQDGTASVDADGSCSGGTTPLVQNTYDVTQSLGGSDNPVGRLTKSVAFTYYAADTGTPSAITTELMQYDQRGRVTTQQLLVSLPSGWGTLPTYQMTQSYNDANQVQTSVTSTLNPAGTGYSSVPVYDATSGVLKGLGNNASDTSKATIASLSYTPNALLGGMTFKTSAGGGSQLANEQFSYDGDLRLSSATASWGTGQIFTQSRSYDPASNVTSLSTTLAAVPGQTGSGGSETQNFCYDEQSRLVWAGNSGTQPAAGNGTCGSGTLSSSLSGGSYNNSFVYTHLGELWKGPLNGSGNYKYLYCTAGTHQLTGLFPTGSGASCTNQAGAVYTSSDDTWGNVNARTVTGGSSAILSYDKLDHFVEWNGSNPTSQEWYAYDSSGNRVLRRSTSGGSTTMTVYVFGVEEHLYSGTGTLQGNTYYYSVAGRLIGALTGQPANKTNIFLTDGLGSVVATFSNTAGSAALLGNQVYGPYGTNRYNKGSMGTNKGFTGQYNDSVTGLDYYNSRYYDPVVGVFLSADKVEGNPSGMNPYDYVGGNPETKNDPTGQFIPTPGGGAYYPPPPPVSGGTGSTTTGSPYTFPYGGTVTPPSSQNSCGGF